MNPRLAMVTHTNYEEELMGESVAEVRAHWDGMFMFGAPDVMVVNVTKDAITMRQASFPDRVTPPSTTEAYKKAPRSGEATMSKYVMDGVWKGFTPPPLPGE